MIEQTATILRVEEDTAYLQVQRQTACGSCSAKSGCGKSLLDNVFKAKPVTLKLPNVINAKEGDEVVVGLNDSSLLQASFYLYFLPLLCMLIMAVIVGYVSSSQYAELFSIVAAVIGLFFGSKISQSILNMKSNNRSDAFQPTLLKIITEANTADAVFVKHTGV